MTGASAGRIATGRCCTISVSEGKVSGKLTAMAIHTTTTAHGDRTTSLPSRWKIALTSRYGMPQTLRRPAAVSTGAISAV